MNIELLRNNDEFFIQKSSCKVFLLIETGGDPSEKYRNLLSHNKSAVKKKISCILSLFSTKK